MYSLLHCRAANYVVLCCFILLLCLSFPPPLGVKSAGALHYPLSSSYIIIYLAAWVTICLAGAASSPSEDLQAWEKRLLVYLVSSMHVVKHDTDWIWQSPAYWEACTIMYIGIFLGTCTYMKSSRRVNVAIVEIFPPVVSTL